MDASFGSHVTCFVSARLTAASPRRFIARLGWLQGNALPLLVLLLLGAAGSSLRAQTANFAGTLSTIAIDSSTLHPEGGAFDAAGNLYLADATSGVNNVWKFPANGDGTYGTPTAILASPTPLLHPLNVAVDPSGNVWVADNGTAANGQVYEIVNTGGTLATTATPVGTGWNAPAGIIADASGNIWVTDNGANTLSEITGGGPPTVINSGLSGPWGLTIDPSSGTMYIAEGSWLDSLPSPYTAAPTHVGGGPYNNLLNVKIDQYKNLWAAEYGGSTVREFTAASSYATVQTWGTGFNGPVIALPDSYGNIIVSNYDGGTVDAIATGAIALGSTAVGNGTPDVTVTFNFTGTSTTIGPPVITTQGTTGSNFTDSGFGTCTTTNGITNPYLPGSSCTVSVELDPTVTGALYGAIKLQDTTGATLATAYLYGSGTGPQIIFDPGTTVPPFAGFNAPAGAAVDVKGDLYVANAGANEILVTPAGGGAATHIGTGVFQDPHGVAVDGLGNIFVADTGNKQVSETSLANGTPAVLGGGFTFTSPNAVAVDQNGNVFVADGGSNHAVEEILAASGYTVVRTLSSSFTNPVGVAVDVYGNVFVADSSVTSIIKLFAVNGQIPASPSVSNFGSFVSPVAIALDGNANLYVLDGGTGTISELPFFSYTGPLELGSGITSPAGLAIDGAGDVFYTNAGSDNKAYELELSVAPTLSFAPTTYLSTSTDSPKLVTITNIGGGFGSTLTLTGLAVVPASFTQTSGAGTFTDCSTSYSLAPDSATASCSLGISFTPQSTGAIAGTATLTDNNLNAAAATQTVTLNGTGNQGTPTLAWSTPAPITYGASLAGVVSGAGAPTAKSGGNTVNGTFTFTAKLTSGGTTTAVTSATVLGAGTWTLTASFTPADSNYSTPSPIAVQLTVNQAPLSITVNSASRVYGAANPTFTGTVTGLVNGDTLGTTVTVAYSTTATVASAVGTYPISANISGASAADYDLTVTAGTLTITQAPLTVTVNDATRAYGAANPTFTDTVTGLLNGDTVTVTYSTTATVTSPVGTYPITATVSGAAAGNYNPTVTPGNLTITQAPLTLTINNATRAYGAANPVFTGTFTGLVNGDTITPTYSTTATVTSPVGSYPISATLSGAALANYNPTIVPGTLTVTQATLTVTINNATRAYGAANPVLTGTITGLVNGDTITPTYSTTATVTSPVGSYPISATLSGAALANYNPTIVPGTLTVTQATLTVTVNNATRAYGVANPTFTGTITGTLNGDSITATYSTTATVTSAAGTYPITATLSGAALSNYNPTITPGTLTVSQATLTITVNSASRVYGAANPTFTGTVTGLQNGDTVTTTYSTTATVISDVGTYPITAAISGAKAANYTATVTAGTLTITKAPLTIAVNSATRVYGAANPTFTGTVTGLRNGDTVTTTYSTTATATSPVGTYPITAAISGAKAGDYTPTVTAGTLTITQATTTVTWPAPAPIIYGTPLSATQLNATANVAGAFTYTPAAGSILSVGANQTLSVLFTPTDSADYKSATATTTITVAATGLTVSANNATRVYGTANPTFTGTITGAQNGDTFTESFTTAATITSNAGTYPIVPSASGPNLVNYTVVINNGTLTITKANTSTGLSASGSSVNPGDTVTLTATVASATSGTPTGSVSFYDGATLLGSGTLTGGVATYSTTSLAAGTSHTITAVYGGDINFNSSSTTTSTGITVGVLDFTLGTPTPATQTGNAGTAFTYAFNISPVYGTYAGDVSFTATGLPAGAAATFSPSTIPANGGPQAVTMIVTTAAGTAALVHPTAAGRGLIPVALAFLILPLVGTRRMRREGRRFTRLACMLLLVLAGLGATAAITGCGSHNGGFSTGQSYTITITATSGAIQHTATVNLDLQ